MYGLYPDTPRKYRAVLQIMNVFIPAMVRIFSFGERLIVPFYEAIAELNGTINLSPNENILTIARIKTFIICFMKYQTIVFQNQFIRHLKQHAFESYFSIWIILHSSQDRN